MSESKYALLICAVLSGCASQPEQVSTLMVINGGEVTDPKQAPGTYGFQYLKDGKVVGNASGVAVSNNTFLTAGHNLAMSANADTVKILDYQGKTVTSFGTQSVKAISDPNYRANSGPASDMGAYILPNNLSADRLTHGIVPISNSGLNTQQSVTLVGNGRSDYRSLDYGNPDRVQGADSGALRWGKNTVSERDPSGNYYLNGQAFATSNDGSNAVSGPGDSGGAVITYDSNGNPSLAGIMQGGSMFSSGTNGANTYFDSSGNPGAISNQPNSAYGYVVGTRSRNDLYEKIGQAGGQIQGYQPTAANGVP